jgi:hypothetical protein
VNKTRRDAGGGEECELVETRIQLARECHQKIDVVGRAVEPASANQEIAFSRLVVNCRLRGGRDGEVVNGEKVTGSARRAVTIESGQPAGSGMTV